jgi:hypothetical protein
MGTILLVGALLLFAYAAYELAPRSLRAWTIRRDHGELVQGTPLSGASAGTTLLPMPAGLRTLRAALIALPAAPAIMVLRVLAGGPGSNLVSRLSRSMCFKLYS